MKETKLTAVIAARMNSSRFPGKTLEDLCGVPMLEFQINRILKSKYVEKVIVITGRSPENNQLESWCRKKSIEIFRGSDEDVLLRICQAVENYSLEGFVEILGDNPFVDPRIIDCCIEQYIKYGSDYVATLTNEYPESDPKLCKFPIGVRVQVLKANAIFKCSKLAKKQKYREHATSFIAENPDMFKTTFLEAKNSFKRCCRPELTFAVNEQKNLELLNLICLRMTTKYESLEHIIDIYDGLHNSAHLMGNS